jgi:hypothetical protein
MRRDILALLLSSVILLAAQQLGVTAAELDFSGSLVRLGKSSISVKLTDGRVIDAMLPHTAGAGAYEVGNEVEITCKRIRPQWEEDTARYQFLEVTNIRVLGNMRIVESFADPPLAQQEANSAAAGSGSTPDSKLEQARKVNLAYAANLPNFVADETAIRYEGEPGSEKWRRVDVIRTEITFKGSQVLRQQIRRNGRRWARPFQSLPGFKWYGGFGSELRPLFDSRCSTSIEYEGQVDMRGKHLLAFDFRAPPDGCFVSFYFEYQRYNPARTGRFLIDEAGGRLVQLSEEAAEFPTDFEFRRRDEEVLWGDVKIGSAVHLLPVKANFEVLYSSGTRWRVDVEYTNHRHFEASTDVVF